ncbi:MAG: ribonuclease P protein component [Planctomycetota bacterium]
MKQFGLSKKERVVNDKEFEKVYKEGTIRKNGRVIIRYLPNDLGYSRLGIAVSKKVFRKAVNRNRIRRLIREAFRLNKNQLPKGLDIIISIRITPDNKESHITLPEIQTELLKIFAGYSC